MVARIAPKLLTDVRKRVERTLADLHRERFGVEAKVRVKDRGFKDYLDLVMTSPKFRGMLPTVRASLVGKWLRAGLTQREYGRIASTLLLTPAEERQFSLNGCRFQIFLPCFSGNYCPIRRGRFPPPSRARPPLKGNLVRCPVSL